MKSREYKFLLKMKIKKYGCKTPTWEYFKNFHNNYHKLTLKNVRSYLVKK